MRAILAVTRWVGALSLIGGLAYFIGSFNSAYTARRFVELRAPSDSVQPEEVLNVLRALDLFMMGIAGLLLAAACFAAVHYLKRMIVSSDLERTQV